MVQSHELFIQLFMRAPFFFLFLFTIFLFTFNLVRNLTRCAVSLKTNIPLVSVTKEKKRERERERGDTYTK